MEMEDYPDLFIKNIKLNTEENDLENWFKRTLEDVCWEEGFIKILGRFKKYQDSKPGMPMRCVTTPTQAKN